MYNHKSGFTLVEIMISVVILTFALLTIMGIFGAVASSSKKGENRLVATALAQQTIEMYKNDLDLDFDKYGSVLPVTGSVETTKNGVNFETDIAILEASGPDPGNTSVTVTYSSDRIREVRVTVKWKEHAGGENSFTLKTYISSR